MAKHTYIQLKDLKVGSKVDVYGVVKFFKQPYKTRGSDWCTMISVVDPSYSDAFDKLKCLLFAREKNKLPDVKLGDIIRFHRLSISEFAGCLQGQSSPGFSWVLFSGDVGASVTALKASSQTYSITDTDKQKVDELRRWASNKDELHEKLCTFSEVGAGCYFDLVCQVVYTSVIEEGVGRLLKVWDGTQCLYVVRDVSKGSSEQSIQQNDALMRQARGLLYDVQVFDDHFRTSQNIKPGDYVKFVNLHAAEYSCPDNRASGQTTVEFVLHRGDSFGRSVKVLPSDSPDLDAMKQRQEIVAMENDSFICSEAVGYSSESSSEQVKSSKDDPNPSTSGAKNKHKHIQDKVNAVGFGNKEVSSGQRSNTSGVLGETSEAISKEQDKIIEGENAESRESGVSDSEPTDSPNRKRFKQSELEQAVDRPQKELQPDKEENNGDRKTAVSPSDSNTVCESGNNSSVPRCLMQTSTVVLGHVHVKSTRISEILEHNVPYKFRVRARVFDYHPKPTSVKGFIKLYCPACHFLSSYPGTDLNQNSSSQSELQIGSTFKGVPHYTCPHCYEHRDSLNSMDSPPHLQYIYMMRLILQDDSGTIMANIWKDDAVQFFQDVEPEQLLQNPPDFTQIQDCLTQICPPNTKLEERPWIECCLKSYCVKEGTGYQIFDTVIV